MKNVIIILTSFLLLSCSGNYKQRYDNYDNFQKINQRNKGWFPAIVSGDCYDFKNDSYLDSLCAFGTFSYVKSTYYDSVFTNKGQIDFALFIEKVKKHNNRRPDWFLDPAATSKGNFEVIKKDGFYIARDKTQKKIYFVLTYDERFVKQKNDTISVEQFRKTK